MELLIWISLGVFAFIVFVLGLQIWISKGFEEAAKQDLKEWY